MPHGAGVAWLVLGLATCAWAEPPATSYIFPAGGQRGTRVQVRVGGHYLHERCAWEMLGPGVRVPANLERTTTLWFEGPLVRLPASQRQEDYPRDYLADVEIAADAPLGVRFWRAFHGQGATAARRFVVGDLPEVIEEELEGEPLPVPVTLPVTINGRIFPREDVDCWTFTPPLDRTVTCAVAATSLGSPLEARLEVLDPQGQPIAESTGGRGEDPLVQFTARVAGVHQVRIHDVRGEGLQPFVYRLTVTDGPWVRHVYPLGAARDVPTSWQLQGANLPVEPVQLAIIGAPADVERTELRWQVGDRWTNSVVVAVDGLAAHEETEPNGELAQAPLVRGPLACLGRIAQPGDRDAWRFAWKKGESWVIDVQAARFGSALDPVVVIQDAQGREVARGADSPTLDPLVRFSPPADGEYVVTVADRFASRGGPQSTYRLAVSPAQPALRLELAADAVSVDRGGQQKLVVQVQREGGFQQPVTLSAEGLPAGVVAADVVVAPNQNRGELVIQAGAEARISAGHVRIVGKAEFEGRPLVVVAAPPRRGGEPLLDQVLLAVTLPTPFKFQGAYEMTYIPCGTVSRKRFVIDRQGFTGPLEVQLADKQARHLQGVTGPVITVPAEATEFVYPITLPPWMELGRTSRVVLMATGEVEDGQGGRHKVTFTSGDQNNQMVNLVSPSPLRIALDRTTALASPNQTQRLQVQLRRDRSLQSSVRLELVIPRGLQDVTAEPVEVPPGDDTGELVLVYGRQPGPLTMPVVIRATARRGEDPLVAEASLELVSIR
ncbi:MAG: hypothetical protein U0935_20595 [Pirellulales bacterium]